MHSCLHRFGVCRQSCANTRQLSHDRMCQPHQMVCCPICPLGCEEHCSGPTRNERSQDDLQQLQGEAQFDRRNHWNLNF